MDDLLARTLGRYRSLEQGGLGGLAVALRLIGLPAMPARAAHSALGLLAAWLLIAGCGAPAGAPERPAPIFNATAEGQGNGVAISLAGATAVVDVQSPSGIGAASIELVSGTPPANIVVRLHVSGLESFRLSYDQTVVAAAVSSGDSRIISQNLELPDGGVSPIAADSPLWLDVRIVSAQTTPTLPLQEGYFEIQLPAGLLNDRQRSFGLGWVDFYR